VASGAQFVVRIDGVDPAASGLHRQLEWRVLKAAHGAGLAPRPRYFNPELGSLVCDYLPPDPVQDHSPADTGRLLARIHDLPPVHHRLDLRDRILRLDRLRAQRGEAEPKILARLRGSVASLLARLPASDSTNRVCHNDLLAANRLRSGKALWALDWEYCAMGSPWYDLAVTACGDDLGESDTDALLAGYLGRRPRDSELALFRDYGRVYRYLELLWYLAQQRLPGDAFMQQRTAALADAWREIT
jgi:thiamine kinase-like enzyme